MPKKIMIITYNDTGGCFVKNYHEGDISVKQKERTVTDKDGNVVATIPTHQNIKMKKMKECEMTSVVLAEPLRKGELAMIGYEYWAYGRVEERDGNISVFIEGHGD